MSSDPELRDGLAEGLARVMSCRDGLDGVLWGEIDPLRGVDAVIKALSAARRAFVAAGFRVEP